MEAGPGRRYPCRPGKVARRGGVNGKEAGATDGPCAGQQAGGSSSPAPEVRGVKKTQNRIGFRGTLADRFEAKYIPEPNSGCWLWFGSTDSKGYGQIRMPGKHGEGRLRYASHVAMELADRPVPDGLCALHHCDMPCCVNPSHLFHGTPRDNTHDMMRKGRGSKPPLNTRGRGLTDFCKRGHPRTGDNVVIVTGGRQCRECNLLRRAAVRAQFIAQGLRCDGLPRKAT